MLGAPHIDISVYQLELAHAQQSTRVSSAKSSIQKKVVYKRKPSHPIPQPLTPNMHFKLNRPLDVQMYVGSYLYNLVSDSHEHYNT